MAAPRIRSHKHVAALPAVLEANAAYYVRRGDGFDLFVTNALGTVVAYQHNGVRVFSSDGAMHSCREFVGRAVTNAQGFWTLDLSKAGFTVPPFVNPQALSKGPTMVDAASATMTERTATRVSGYVTTPLGVLLLSGPPLKFVGAGWEVDVMAIGI